MDILEKISKGKIKGYLMINQRIIFQGAIYHITQRAPGKESLFLEESDYLRFLKLLKESVGKFNLELFCFALLPNHVHLLLRIRKENLSEAMKNLFERYAIYFNQKYKRKGHVFCGRYRASLCNDEGYFLAVSIYIHLNPYKAGLCRNLKEYRWSSFNLYTGASKSTFVDFRQILSILDPKIDEARKIYLAMIEEASKFKGGSLIDADSVKVFIRAVARAVNVTVGKDSENLDRLIEDFNSKNWITNPKDKKARKYLIEQLLARGYSLTEIARVLSLTRMTIYRTLR